jgi:hypothetical protein
MGLRVVVLQKPKDHPRHVANPVLGDELKALMSNNFHGFAAHNPKPALQILYVSLPPVFRLAGNAFLV